MPFLKAKTEIRLKKVSKTIVKNVNFPTTKITEQSPFFKLKAVLVSMQNKNYFKII